MGAVKEECKMRHEEMTKMVREMGRKVETKNQEMGKRLKKHEDETKECFSIAKGELTERQREIEQVKDELPKIQEEQTQI